MEIGWIVRTPFSLEKVVVLLFFFQLILMSTSVSKVHCITIVI
jgi:hypothetical protein